MVGAAKLAAKVTNIVISALTDMVDILGIVSFRFVFRRHCAAVRDHLLARFNVLQNGLPSLALLFDRIL
jgi:hypothetical protein